MDNSTEMVTIESLGYKVIEIPAELKLNVELPSWLSSWEEAEFIGITDNYGNPFGYDAADEEIRAAAYLASMTGGIWMNSNDSTLEKRGVNDFNNQLLAYLKSGDVLHLQEMQVGLTGINATSENSMQKRANACFARNTWIRSTAHVARVTALSALSYTISGACDWMVLGRSAICGADSQGQQACVSWDGGWQTMKGCVAKAVLDSAANNFGGGNEDISAYCAGCAGCVHTWNYKRSNENEDQACVSNRPNGCSGHSYSKRFDWDTDSYGWCYGSAY